MSRLTTMCQLWPSISPHGPEQTIITREYDADSALVKEVVVVHPVPNSVWNLAYGVWRGFAAATDRYIADMKKG